MLSTQRSPPNGSSNRGKSTNLAGSDPTLNKNTTNMGSNEQIHNITRRTRRRLDQDAYEPNESDTNYILTEMTKLFTKFEQKQDSKLASLNLTMNNIQEQNLEIQDSINFMSKKYDDLLLRVESSERENASLKCQINSLETKMELLERNSRSNMLEIKNLPITGFENNNTLSDSLIKIATVVNQPIQQNVINQIYRLKSKQKNPSNINPVIVEFTSVSTKENILKAIRNYNRENKDSKLSSTHLNIPGPPRPIFVDESLTKQTKHLFYLARTQSRQEHYDSCWVSHGKIYIKKKAEDIPIRIDSELKLNGLGRIK